MYMQRIEALVMVFINNMCRTLLIYGYTLEYIAKEGGTLASVACKRSAVKT